MNATESVFAAVLRQKNPQIQFSPELELICREHLKTLLDDNQKRYAPETLELISIEAASKLYDLAGNDGNWSKHWFNLVDEFKRGTQWGFKSKERKDPNSEGLSYIRVFFQALAMKTVVLYFGIRVSDDPSLVNWLCFGASLLFSFGSLFLFGWLKYSKEEVGPRPKLSK